MNKHKIIAWASLGFVGYVAYKAWLGLHSDKGITNADGTEGINGSFFKAVSYVVADLGDSIMVGGVNDDLTPSMELMNFTKGFESLRLEPYAATKAEADRGIFTIGYGHVIKANESFNKITESEADKLFIDDLTEHCQEIYKVIGVRLTQNQFDALCDFCFNSGRYALTTYTGLTNYINDGNFDDAANKFMSYVQQWSGGRDRRGNKIYVKVAGLMNRRYSQMNIFRFGKYERYQGFSSKNI